MIILSKSLRTLFFKTSKRDSRLLLRRYAIDRSVPSEADVVIVGGGVIGCQTIYHLTKLGVTNVVLLERDKLTSGTTWHTAGLLWRLRPSDVDIQILGHTHKVFTNLEAETGMNPGWINNGGLFIANNKQRLDEYKRMYTLGKAFGVESFILSREETKKLYPLMNVDDVYGTLYSPQDGTIDPNGLCQALARFSKKAGAKIIENCAVEDVETQEYSMGSKKVTGVKTPYGLIKTDCVVNCTGAWANYISNMVGIQTPLTVMKHAYVITDKIPGIENTPNVRDHDASVYIKLQGDVLHLGGYEHNPIFWDKVEKNFAFGLFELDWDVFGVHLEGAMHRIPCLEKTGIKSTVCGPESFTPDHKPIMGEDPRVRGFFHGVGFNSSGMMLGGGCGNQLANWVVRGRPEIDMYAYDIRRFCPETSLSTRWVEERSHEAYAKNYSTVFLHDQPLSGRNIKKDPLHDELTSAGSFFEERFGWERPGWFNNAPAPVKNYDWYSAYGHEKHEDYLYRRLLEEDYTFEFPPRIHSLIKKECLAARTTAALFNMSYFGKVYLTGRDAQKAADWIFSNKMDVEIGKTVYTCMLNKYAGIEADLTVSPIESGSGGPADPQFEGPRGFYLATGGGIAYQNIAHILHEIQDKGFDVELKDYSRKMGLLSVQGPKARDILEKLAPHEDWSNEGFPFSTNKMVILRGHKVRAMRLSFVGELGWELHVPEESCLDIYRALHEVGAPMEMINAGYRAIDSLSLEKGYPHWHMEIRSDDNPIEAGLLFVCKLKSEVDFQGREELLKLKASGGPFKRKACFTLDQPDVYLLGQEVIYRNGEVVGFVRRGDFAFFLDKPIAYGYIADQKGGKITVDWLKAGSYEIECMGQKFPAKFHPKTPFDPKNERMQGIYN